MLSLLLRDSDAGYKIQDAGCKIQYAVPVSCIPYLLYFRRRPN